jgi:hypothetical protein
VLQPNRVVHSRGRGSSKKDMPVAFSSELKINELGLMIKAEKIQDTNHDETFGIKMPGMKHFIQTRTFNP